MSSFSRFQNFSAKLRPGQIAMGLFEVLPDIMFWVKDDSGMIIFANRAYAQLLNRTPEDLVGETDETLFPPTMANFFRSDDEKILRNSKPFQNKLSYLGSSAYEKYWDEKTQKYEVGNHPSCHAHAMFSHDWITPRVKDMLMKFN